MTELNRCGNNGAVHSLIPVSWELSANTKHVGQLLCEKCFRLFDHEEIAKFHTEHHRNGSGNVSVD